MTTPTGDPAWARTSDASTYGGHPEKRNYAGQDSVNPKTDVSAQEFIRLCADVAGLARVAPFAVITLTCNDTTPAAPTINSARQMNGVSTNGYPGDAAPVGFPAGARVGDGSVTLTWPEEQLDDYGVPYDLDAVHAVASVVGEAGYGHVSITRVNGYTWTLAAIDDAGAAIDDAQITLEIL